MYTIFLEASTGLSFWEGLTRIQHKISGRRCLRRLKSKLIMAGYIVNIEIALNVKRMAT